MTSGCCTLLLYIPDQSLGRLRLKPLTCGNVVGVTGFEPAASSSRTKRATKLRHTPWHPPPWVGQRQPRIADRPAALEIGSADETRSGAGPGEDGAAGRPWPVERRRARACGGPCSAARQQGEERRLGPAGEPDRRERRGPEPGRDVEVCRRVGGLRRGRPVGARATTGTGPWPGDGRGRSSSPARRWPERRAGRRGCARRRRGRRRRRSSRRAPAGRARGRGRWSGPSRRRPHPPRRRTGRDARGGRRRRRARPAGHRSTPSSGRC